MVGSPWKVFAQDRDTPGGQESRRRQQTKRSVLCEALDNRRLLSTVVPVATVFSMPPAAVVTKAASILESDAPRALPGSNPPWRRPSGSHVLIQAT